MSVYLKQFSTHSEYEQYINDSGAILPNVSICTTEGDVHYNPLVCEETSIYEVIGTPTYPSTVEGDATSFDITVDYRRTDTDIVCQQTVTEGSDTVTVEIGQNPSTSASRTVSGTVDYHGNEIEYSITQSKFEAKVTAKFNVIDTSNATRITSQSGTFTKIEIDGVEQPYVVTAYTFSTTGEHIVKYTLTSPSDLSGFQYCRSLTSIEIPSTVIYINTNTFQGCNNLTSINIPSGLRMIYNTAFFDCSGLTSIVIPSGVTSIGDSAFYGCKSLTSIAVEATTPPTLGNSYVFGDTNNCPIYVPSESVETYKAATNWSSYSSRIQPIA